MCGIFISHIKFNIRLVVVFSNPNGVIFFYDVAHYHKQIQSVTLCALIKILLVNCRVRLVPHVQCSLTKVRSVGYVSEYEKLHSNLMYVFLLLVNTQIIIARQFNPIFYLKYGVYSQLKYFILGCRTLHCGVAKEQTY